MIMRMVLFAVALLLGAAWAQSSGCQADELVHIPDDDLRNAVQDALGLLPPQPPIRSVTEPVADPPITCRDIQDLTVLHLSAPRHIVRSLEGLEHAANLATLRLDTIPVPIPGTYQPHEIDDLEPLRHLAKLQFVSIQGRGEIDLEPLVGLANLEHLTIIGFELPDLTPLVHLENLDLLALTSAGVRDLSPFQRWAHPPAQLSLTGNRISDLHPLAANTNFDAGHQIDLTHNCLSARATSLLRETDIGTLRARGVSIVIGNQFPNSGACTTTPSGQH